MRILVMLFAIYILILPTIPCMDSDDCAQVENVDCNESENDHDEKPCNPFCICNCCGTVIAYKFDQTIIDKKPETYIAKQLYLTTSPFFCKNYLSKIWQPPRLV